LDFLPSSRKKKKKEMDKLYLLGPLVPLASDFRFDVSFINYRKSYTTKKSFLMLFYITHIQWKPQHSAKKNS
jgi:hypothetical protein